MLSEKMHDVPSLSLITIKDCDAGQRIDRWLRSRYPNVSQSLLQKLIRKGNIRVNKYKIKPNYIVNIGEKIFIPLVLQESNPKKTNRTSGFISEKDQNFVKSLVIYKDDHIFALNKPHGLASQGGSGQIHHIDFLIRGLVANAEIDDCPRLVHRLDIGTSGTLLLARTRIAAQKLTELFRDHKIVKIYWACVMGKPTKVHGIISSDVAKKTSTQIMETTCYSLIKHSDIHNVSWLALYPLTGKKHQLRRHLQTLNTPIIGDKQYGFSP
jgi:23S rRNA pseudouridine955/2504/2580 synthase